MQIYYVLNLFKYKNAFVTFFDVLGFQKIVDHKELVETYFTVIQDGLEKIKKYNWNKFVDNYLLGLNV